MLLQRLAEHSRHLENPAPPFYRVRAIRWMIHLRSDGTLMTPGLSGLANDDHPAGTPDAVPYIYRSGQRPPAMLLADDLRYVLGHPGAASGEKEAADADRRHADYTGLLTRWRDSAPGDPVAQAVVSFFASGLARSLGIPPEAKVTDVAAIMVGDDVWAHDQASAVAFWRQVATERKGSANTGICLVCGVPGALLDTIPAAIKSGAIPVGAGRGRDAQLVSVNKPAQGRGGKIQLASSPVCTECGSAVMSTLNALLASDMSRYRMSDSVLTWWLREPQEFPWMSDLDNPEPDRVRTFIETLYKRRPVMGAARPNSFYAITLSVNQSRAVVRDWIDIPVAEVERNIGRWYAEHRVTSYRHDQPETAGLRWMALSTGRWGTENGQERYLKAFMPHGCDRDLLLTALHGIRPPGYLLPHLLQRIRADRRMDHPRAALLRLILIRNRATWTRDMPEEKYMAGLDPDLSKTSYQCGRAFAVLEQIQRAALGSDINTTIADKYLSAASATPLPILVMLRKSAGGHLRRIRRTNRGAYAALSTRLDDVLARLDGESGLPRTLDLNGQAEFLLGYHHQRAADIAAARARIEQNKPVPDDGDTR